MNASDLLNVISVPVPLMALAVSFYLSSRSRDREVGSERARLTALLSQADIDGDGGRSGEAPGEADALDGEERTLPPIAPNTARADRFTPLLIEYYAYGLVQAKRHSMLSLVMSTLGGIVVIVGVTGMIVRAQSGENIAGAAVSTGVGLLTNGIAVLFHRQSNEALRHMQEQTLALRDDMRQERESSQALEQVDAIQDPVLRDRLRAGVVLRLSNASLPSFDSRNSASDPGPTNGSSAAPVPTNQPASTTPLHPDH